MLYINLTVFFISLEVRLLLPSNDTQNEVELKLKETYDRGKTWFCTVTHACASESLGVYDRITLKKLN